MNTHGTTLCADCKRRIAEAARAHRARVREKARPRLDAEKATKAAQQAASAEIRAAVFRRAGPFCEVPECSRPPDEWHHIASGSSRKLEESAESTCAICILHHRLAHAGDRETLKALLGWAISKEFRPAARALTHRIDKIDEARRTA